MNFALALTGPTGAGKTTVARILASSLPECVNIEVDHVKMFIVSGYRYEEPSGVDQWRLLGRNLGMLGANFVAAGYNLIVNGFLTLEAWQELDALVRFSHRVVLLPDLEVNVQRDDERPYADWLGPDEVQRHQTFFRDEGYFAGFNRIDSSDQSAEETAEAIRGLLTGS